MAKKTISPPADAPPDVPTYGQRLAESLANSRAERIRAARARTPTPTYEQIAVEVGCCVKTVYNALKAGGADG